MKISILIVSYNCRELLRQTLDSIYATLDDDFEVVVVENGSDGGAEEVVTHYPQTKLILNPINSGFAAANNIAFRHSQGKYVLLLNPDTLVSSNTIDPMIRFMDSNPKCGICGPRVLDIDRRHTTNPCFAFDPTDMFRDLVYKRVLRRPRQATQPNSSCIVDYAHGCCMLVRRNVYEDLGGLDETLFMYCEEFEFSSRARAKGWETWFLADAEVIHQERPSLQPGYLWAIPLRWHSALRVYGRYRTSTWMVCFRAAAIGHLALDVASAFVRHLTGRSKGPLMGILRANMATFFVLLVPVELGRIGIPAPRR